MPESAARLDRAFGLMGTHRGILYGTGLGRDGPGRDFVTLGFTCGCVPRHILSKSAFSLRFGSATSLSSNTRCARVALKVATDRERASRVPRTQLVRDECTERTRPAPAATYLGHLVDHVGRHQPIGQATRAPRSKSCPNEQCPVTSVSDGSSPLLVVEHVIVIAEPAHPVSSRFRRWQ